MAQSRDSITWGVFHTVISGLVALTVIIVGDGFTWMHSDLSDVRTDIREIRGSVQDLLKAIGAIKEQMAITHAKLDAIKEETRKSR